MNYQPYNAPYSNLGYQPQRFSAPSNGIIWVQGIEGAKAFQLVPNSNTVLLDSENEGIFYIKLSDSVGMCTLRTFKFTEVTTETTNKTNVDMSVYATKADLESAFEKLKEIIENEQFVSAIKPDSKNKRSDYNVKTE